MSCLYQGNIFTEQACRAKSQHIFGSGRKFYQNKQAKKPDFRYRARVQNRNLLPISDFYNYSRRYLEGR